MKCENHVFLNVVLDMFGALIGKNGEDILHPQVIEDFKKRDLPIKKIVKHYFGGEKITPENISEYIQLASDTLLVSGIQEALAIQMKASTAPTYYYIFSFHSEKTLMKARMQCKLPGNTSTFSCKKIDATLPFF